MEQTPHGICNSFPGSGIADRQVDDIVAAQCHRQSRPVQWQDQSAIATTFLILPDSPGLIEFLAPILACIRGVEQ